MAFLLQPSQLKWNPDDSSHATYPGYVSIAPRSVAVFFFLIQILVEYNTYLVICLEKKSTF